MSFTGLELRDVLGRFATGVCLVTVTDAAGAAHAVTVNSFASVSLDPPLVLWSLQKGSDVYGLYADAPLYAINVLSEAQQDLSTRYSQKGGHLMAREHFRPGENGAPVVVDAIAHLECSLEAPVDGGDHTILIGRVTRIRVGESAPPLLFFGGAYRRLS
jgi:flavin reductase (DIM6/NTAB) family NADH-FMN oxidoreductase RutF